MYSALRVFYLLYLGGGVGWLLESTKKNRYGKLYSYTAMLIYSNDSEISLSWPYKERYYDDFYKRFKVEITVILWT